MVAFGGGRGLEKEIRSNLFFFLFFFFFLYIGGVSVAAKRGDNKPLWRPQPQSSTYIMQYVDSHISEFQ